MSQYSPTKSVAPIITAPAVIQKRVWVRRIDGNPTCLYVKENHIVDDLKMMIIDKFPTTLAKLVDPGDLIIRLEPSSLNNNNNNSATPMSPQLSRKSFSSSPLSPIPISIKQQSSLIPKDYNNLQRLSPSSSPLEPDRSIWNILETYYPNGMTVENSFIVEIPNNNNYNYKRNLSSETIPENKEEEYFPRRTSNSVSSIPRRPPSSPNSLPPTSLPPSSTTPSNHRRSHSNPAEQSSAVLLLPSSSSDQSWKKHQLPNGNQQQQSDHQIQGQNYHAQHQVQQQLSQQSKSQTPQLIHNQIVSPEPRVNSSNSLHNQAKIADGNSTMAKVLPSVSVLIVEDNLVNLKILSTHLKRHKIQYDTAKNGKEAIDKWKKGGFHLVLMDIQLPVMSGLEASREIRRLEKINNVGVFNNSKKTGEVPKENEILDLTVFRSPIIIVALTASNLKQDKQEALAAGCNDYLTKPVNLDWLLNKITEWGCMQALIDFDGWKSGERMTNISAAIPKTLTRKTSGRV